MNGDPRRELPAVDRLLRRPEVVAWSERWGERSVKRALRQTIEASRRRIGAGEIDRVPGIEPLLEEAARRLRASERPSLRRVLNGTGVVLHTNLGRAPLAEEALEAVVRVAGGYSNLEFDLETGERGSRYTHCVELLRELTGAEDALVVNNNAAAVSLAVNELARGREVVVSRGEMIEIGGSFRIPAVVERSGAELRGVGTTNRTRLSDYAEAIGNRTGLLLRVHPANYAVRGFSQRVPLGELAALGRERSIPVVHDLGSGLLRPELLEGFPEEPSPAASIGAGVDLVTWSGDKLLGGPQAGVILGSEACVSRLRDNPLLRAFRVDKATLASLEATLRIYREPERAARELPVLARLAEPASRTEERASRGLEDSALAGLPVRVERFPAVVGGGAFPEHTIPSAGWAVEGPPPTAVDRACRASEPPLVGRIREDRFLVDVRTLAPEEVAEAARVLAAAVEEARDAE